MHRVNVITLLYSFVAAVADVLPLVVGTWLTWRGLRGGPDFPSCGKCRYDVTGSIGTATRCPECGSPFAEVGIVKPRGRQRPLLVFGGLVLVVAAVGCLGTSLSGLMAWKAQLARSQAALRSAQMAALAPTTSPAVGDTVSTEEQSQPDQEPPE
jgi:hypothetical protein